MLVHRRNTARCATALAAACLGLLLPSLAAPPASAAGPTSVVTVEPLGHSGSGAAGTCLLYRVVPRDAAFEESVTSAGQGGVSVSLVELNDHAQQDVDFCTVGGRGDAFSIAPKYTTGHAESPVSNRYNPGETVTPEEPANPVKARQDVPPAVTTTNTVGRPDIAAVEPPQSSQSAPPTNNPKSTDSATLLYDADAGGFVFGVTGLMAGSARLTAFFDRNADGDPDTSAPTPVEPGGDVHADPVTVQLTQGGPPWSLTAANAVRVVEATARTASVVAGSSSGTPLGAVVRNAEGHPVAGVVPKIAAEGGTNAGSVPTWSGSCGASDSTGRAACSYTASAAGTDDVVIWVNQAVSGATAGRDASEPFDAVTVQVDPASAARPSASPSSSSAPATTSPSPTATATPTPTPEQTTAAPEPSARTCATSLLLDRTVITAMQSTGVVVRGAPGTAVRLLAYSRPSTTYRVVREGTTGPDGTASFTVRPLTSSRLYAVEEGCPQTPSQVLQVRSALTLGATRTGLREVLFSGRAVPARAGQLVSLYRTSAGRQVLTGQVRTDARGAWALRRSFSGTGRFGFVARTGADLVNASGTSPVRAVDVR